MYSIYKLKNGKILSFFTCEFFKSCLLNNSKHIVKKLEGREIDLDGRYITNLFHVDLLKDDNGFYFIYDDEKVYVNDYIYLSVKELINKIRYENINIYEFISTLIREGDNVIVVEKIPRINDDLSGNINIKEVPCKLVDDKYKESLWLHHIEMIPIDEKERKIYGKSKYYVADLYFFIKTGYFKIYEKSEYFKSLNKCKKMVLKK